MITKLRVAGLLVICSSTYYLPWMVSALNWHGAWWLALPFALINLYLVALTIISIINNWQNETPGLSWLKPGEEVEVGIIIPTYNESAELIWNTLTSVVTQDYPKEKMVIYVTDDGHRIEISQMVSQFSHQFNTVVHYHAPQKHSDNKAGNMNDCLRRMMLEYPNIKYVETRDCDDLVGEPLFLRCVLSSLVNNHILAYVQSIKEVDLCHGDYFGNQEALFYKASLPARHHTNSVFPCGSGVVYRLEALSEIGGFDTTGPVEDLRTGYRLLKKGWSSAFVPVVGAIGQIAPNDIPNVLKQRGTWALDTVSLLIWDNPLKAKGLSWRQKLSFLELLMFYIFSFGVIGLIAIPTLSLFTDLYPLVTTHWQYIAHFWPFAVSIELYLLAMTKGLPFEEFWKSRQLWVGLAPVFAKATIQAIQLGPKRKPKYKVTRKHHEYGVYLKDVLPQLALSLILLSACMFQLSRKSVLTGADLGSLFWSSFFIINLSLLVMGSMNGVKLFQLPKFFNKEFFMQQPKPKWLRRALSVLLLGLLTLGACAAVQARAQEAVSPTFLPLVISDGSGTNPTLTATPVPPTASPSPTASPTATATPTAMPTAEPTRHVPDLGVHLEGVPYTGFEVVKQFEVTTTKPISYVLWFQAWGNGDAAFNSTAVSQAHSAGLIPVITWEPWKRDFQNPSVLQPEYSLTSIISGDHDDYIRQWAQAARDVGGPIVLRFGHEQSTPPGEKTWYPWQGEPQNYRAAFRRIVRLFREEGADNVKFLWSAMWLDKWAADYYPGNDIVDMVGTTVLNHGTVPQGWAKWWSFTELFYDQYQAALTWDKPIMITELASAEQGGSKALWYREAFSGFRDQYQLVTAIFLLELESDRAFPEINWSITSSSQTLATFQEEVNKD